MKYHNHNSLLCPIILAAVTLIALPALADHRDAGHAERITHPPIPPAPEADLHYAPSAVPPAPTQSYSHGNPSDREQYMLELLNRARANPAAEGTRLANTTDQDVLQAYAAFNVSTSTLTNDFAGYPSRGPLAFNDTLHTAALRQANDMADNDFQGHVGSDGSTLADRVQDAGYSYSLAGENVYAYAYSLYYGHAALLVDWGVPDLGHRINCLNYNGQADFREIGLAVVDEVNTNTGVGPLVIGQVFGTPQDDAVFIVGVVYRDSNANGFYDPDEGIGNVRVMPSGGQYYGVTSSSGGYAIPVDKDSGSYSVSLDSSVYSAPAVAVTVAADNVKADFVVGSSTGGVTVSGTVTSADKSPITGAKVTLPQTGTTVTTGTQGTYSMSNISAGTYTVSISHADYTFSPSTQTIQVGASSVSGVNFTGTYTGGGSSGGTVGGGLCGFTGMILLLSGCVLAVRRW